MILNLYRVGVALVLSGMLGVFSGCHSPEQVEDRNIIPQPLSMIHHEGTFVFGPETVISVADTAQQVVANVFSSLFTHTAGFTPKVVVRGEGDISLAIDASMKPEAYELSVSPDKIIIRSADNRGFFYALQSLRLMLPASIEGKQPDSMVSWEVRSGVIKDEPRFEYRGFMLDVSRYFLPKSDLLQMVDCMAMLKLNRLHLHLTDDNGWRLEIKKYPRLTEVGAWRVDRQHLLFPARRNPGKEEPTPIGGFYTQEEMKEVIRYAASRQIEIIPEIDVPAHSNAALASYPELACPVVDRFIGVLPGLGGKNSEIIFCAGNELSFKFLQDVLDEVMDLFPSRYIHLGGDEAAKTNWKKCPLCQARIRKECLADEEALQGYFMGRISDYVRSKGKEVMGWDELTNSKLPEKAIIFGWQGYGNTALKAAQQGHRFVMTPAKVTYLIRYQGPQWFEPWTYFGNNTLKDLFDYEPVPDSWKPEYEKLLLGVQASMWTEFCNKPDDVFYQVFPRLAALAEIAWTPKGKKEWNTFLKGLDNYLAHLDVKKVVYARSMYNIQHQVMPDFMGNLNVRLSCERPDMEVRYTLDGKEPSASSALYQEELKISCNTLLKVATFANGRQMGHTLHLPVNWNKATAKPLVNNSKGMEILVNGLRGSLKQTDFEWYTGGLNTPIEVTVDLQKEETISQCVLGCVTNYGMGVHKPRKIIVEISKDNETFVKAGEISFSDNEIFKEGNFIDDLSVKVNGCLARYVKFIVETPGDCPPDHVRPGQPSRVYLDEIIIK